MIMTANFSNIYIAYLKTAGKIQCPQTKTSKRI